MKIPGLACRRLCGHNSNEYLIHFSCLLRLENFSWWDKRHLDYLFLFGAFSCLFRVESAIVRSTFLIGMTASVPALSQFPLFYNISTNWLASHILYPIVRCIMQPQEYSTILFKHFEENYCQSVIIAGRRHNTLLLLAFWWRRTNVYSNFAIFRYRYKEYVLICIFCTYLGYIANPHKLFHFLFGILQSAQPL